MKDTEKQIEEIAEIIDDIDDNARIRETRWDGYIALANSEKIVAELLKHYQIVDKDRVVLSREEYSEYVELRNSEVGELVKENRELGKQCLNWLNLYHKQLTKTNKARKETVEKIKGFIFSKLYEATDDLTRLILREIYWQVDELAKRFGVEIKED